MASLLAGVTTLAPSVAAEETAAVSEGKKSRTEILKAQITAQKEKTPLNPGLDIDGFKKASV